MVAVQQRCPARLRVPVVIPRHELPRLALSVHQPWAWAIIHAGMNVESRTVFAVRHLEPKLGPRAIHASKAMAQSEYEHARKRLAVMGIECPPADELQRGGIIGRVDVSAIVSTSLSPWFTGPKGLVFENAAPCEFVPAVGDRGYFAWKAADASIVPPPAKWMLPSTAVEAAAKARTDNPQLDLIDLVQS